MSFKIEVWVARDADERFYMHFVEPHFEAITMPSWHSASYIDITGTALDKQFQKMTVKSKPKRLVIS